MKAWEAMEVNKLYNMLDAIMFAYTYRGVASTMDDVLSTGMKEVYHIVRLEIFKVLPDLRISKTPLADYCARVSKKEQRLFLRWLNL